MKTETRITGGLIIFDKTDPSKGFAFDFSSVSPGEIINFLLPASGDIDFAALVSSISNKADLVGGKVPLSQLPNGIMEYQGTYNVATNTPTLANGGGNPDEAIGNVYRVTVEGTRDFGAGNITFNVNDYVVLNSSKVWEKWDTTDLIQIQLDLTPVLGGDLTLNSKVLLGKMKRGTSATDFIEEDYFHAINLAANQAGASITALQYSAADYEGAVIEYKMKSTVTGNIKVGRIIIANNATLVQMQEQFIEETTNSMSGFVFPVPIITGGLVTIRYNSPVAQGAVMRADMKKFKV